MSFFDKTPSMEAAKSASLDAATRKMSQAQQYAEGLSPYPTEDAKVRGTGSSIIGSGSDTINGIGLNDKTTSGNEGATIGKSAIGNMFAEQMGHVPYDVNALDWNKDRFNRFQMPLLNAWTKVSYAHVFVTKPNLNLFNSIPDMGGTTPKELVGNFVRTQAEAALDPMSTKKIVSENSQLYRYAGSQGLTMSPDLLARVKGSPNLFKYLDSQVQSDGPFIIPFYNGFRRISGADASIETTSSARNSRGMKMDYGIDISKSLADGVITMDIHDDDNMINFHLVDLWVKYISAVKSGRVIPRFRNLVNNILDYTCSVYLFMLGDDGQTIKYYCKWTGCFPNAIPYSAFEALKRNVSQNEFTLQMKFTEFSAMDPSILGEFAHISMGIHKIPDSSSVNSDVSDVLVKLNPLATKSQYNPGFLGNYLNMHERTYDWYFPNAVTIVPATTNVGIDDLEQLQIEEGDESAHFKLLFYNDGRSITKNSSTIMGMMKESALGVAGDAISQGLNGIGNVITNGAAHGFSSARELGGKVTKAAGAKAETFKSKGSEFIKLKK